MVDTPIPEDIAETDDRVRFRASDVRRMVDAGILDDEGRCEVIEGEIIAVTPPNAPHMDVKRWLQRTLCRQLDDTYWVDSEPGFYLEPDGDYTLPDIIVYPSGIKSDEVRGPDALLVIEVADRSLKKDRGRKARLYARHGVREYWVVDARKRMTYRYAAPVEGRYPPETKHGAEETLVPVLLPQVSLRLQDIEAL
jgi:Uma2 family endonuclease